MSTTKTTLSQSVACQLGGLVSIQSHSMWNLWWIKWQWRVILPGASAYPCQYYATNSPSSFIYHQHFITLYNHNKTLPSHLHNVTTHKPVNYTDTDVKTPTVTHETHFRSRCSCMVAVTIICLSHDAENDNKLLSWWQLQSQRKFSL